MQITAYTKANSEKSPFKKCFKEAIIIVKNKRKDETRVNNPIEISIAPKDSANDARNPKKT